MLSKGLREIYIYVSALCIPVVFGLAAFSKVFLRIFFGENFVAGEMPLTILVISVVFFMFVQMNNSVLSGIGKPKIATKIIFSTAFVNLVANLILIVYLGLGIFGAAIGTGISYVFAFIISKYHISREVSVKIPWLDFIKILFAGLIFTLIINVLRGLITVHIFFELIITLGVASLVYIGLIYVMRVVKISRIKKLAKDFLK
jgi:O-antigen/teichoic acid export membrane protein